MKNRSLGKIGEELAERYLLWKGYRVIDRNLHVGRIEIDLIAVKANTIIFVEVKTRRSIEFGKPFEAVTSAKQNKLRAAAEMFLANSSENKACRFDVISIEVGKDNNKVNIDHIENAF